MTPQTRQGMTLLLWAALVPSALSQPAAFAPPQDFQVPSPTIPVFADFNGDGRKDVIVLSRIDTTSANLYFYAGLSAPIGRFAAAVVSPLVISAPNVPRIAAGDFDNDGKQDLVVTGSPVLFYKGNGNGTFQVPVTTGFSTGTNTFLPVDIDGDGKLDLVYGQSFAVRKGNGLGAFAAAVSVFGACTDPGFGAGTGLANPSILLADLNRDGLADAITSCSGAGASVAYRNQDLTFGQPVLLVNYSGLVAVADFDGNGTNDVVVIGSGTNQAFIRFGSTQGFLGLGVAVSLPALPSFGPYSVAAADFNFDGRTDIAYTTNLSLEVLTFNGASFSTLFSVPFPTQIDSSVRLELFDLNGDGAMDTYLKSASVDQFSVYLSQPPSVFLSSSANPVAVGAPITLSANVASQLTGTFYTNAGQVTFYNGSSPLGGPVALLNGQATLATSSLPQGVNYLRAVYQVVAGGATASSALVTIIVAPSACAVASSGGSVTAGGFRFDRITNQFLQDIEIVNNTLLPIPGPITVIVANLSPNANLVGNFAKSICNSPGSSAIDIGLCQGTSLAPNQRIRATLRFANPSRAPITYTPVTVAGLSQR